MAIKSFKDKETAAAFAELPVRSHPPDIRRRALAKLQQLDAAMSLEDLRVPRRATASRRSQEIVRASTASASTNSGDSASCLARMAQRMWKFRSTTSEEGDP